MLAWFKATLTIFGLPVAHWVIVVFCVGAIAEYVLGRSKNPEFRSIAGTIFTGLKKLCVFAHVDQVPVVKQILDFIAPEPAVVIAKEVPPVVK
jgi:hypothetical protein